MNQPGRAFLYHAQNRNGRVRLIQRLHTAEFLDVLGRFLFGDVEHVVTGHDADEHSVGINHRQGRAIVFAKNVQRVLL